jgi:glycosyltransferase involved in cell wall biosynthesis
MTYVTPAREPLPRCTVEDDTRVLRLGSHRAVLSPTAFVARALTAAAAAVRPPRVLLVVTDLARRQAPLLAALRLRGVATVFVRTMAWERYEPVRSEWRLGAVDYAVASTELVCEQMLARGAPWGRSRVISNGVDLQRFRPATSAEEVRALRQELGLPVAGPVCLFVGLLVERKGIVELLEAWQRHRASGGRGTLVLVGDERRYPGDEQYQRRLAELRGRFDHDQVLVVPATRAVELYYRAADLFVFLSRREGFGNVLLEAMASGIPVLCTRFQGYSREHGRGGIDLMLTAGGADATAKRLGALLRDPELAARLGRGGRRWVEARHSVEDSVDDWAALCHEAALRARTWHRGLLDRAALHEEAHPWLG